MEQIYTQCLDWIRVAGIWAPLLFITLHLMRPLLFLPVVLLCITGGLLFGSFMGTIYSLIGITLSSLLFYQMRHWLPGPFQKVSALKMKLLGKHKELSVQQIALLRLIPFMHFFLLSLCIYEISPDFKQYARTSLLTNMPLALLYTLFGKGLSQLPPIVLIACLFLLIPALYLLRKKQASIRWSEFFQPGTS